jgi:hypothetical protein
MPKQIRRRQVSLQQARAYLGKAEQYVEAASAELEAGRSIAAASLAVHAGINAADAVTGMRLGQRAAGQNHDEVLALLRRAGADGAAIERDLLRLLPLKTKASPSAASPQDKGRVRPGRRAEGDCPKGRRMGPTLRGRGPAGRRWTRPVLNLASSGRSVLCPRDRTNPNWTEERWAQNGHTTHSEGPPFEFQLGWSEPKKCGLTRCFSEKYAPRDSNPEHAD